MKWTRARLALEVEAGTELPLNWCIALSTLVFAAVPECCFCEKVWCDQDNSVANDFRVLLEAGYMFTSSACCAEESFYPLLSVTTPTVAQVKRIYLLPSAHD